MKLLNKAGEMPSLEPPDDESIRTLYVGGLDARITEQDLRDNFYAHGEIESVKLVLQRACAFVTYTTREGAEKAAEELSNRLVIKGLRMKLLWGRPQAPRPEAEVSDQQAVTHSGLLPRAVISQQQNQPPGTQDQQPPQVSYFNIPPLPQQDRAYYPSMDPQRMGAIIPSQDGASGSGGSSGEGKLGPPPPTHPGPRYGHPGMPPPPPPQGQFYPPHYPPYGYMPRPGPPPSQQQYPPAAYQPRIPGPPPPGGDQQQRDPAGTSQQT